MTALYSTLTPASKLALDAYNQAVIQYEWSHEEENRVILQCATEAMLRTLLADMLNAVRESDEAATGAA